MLSDNAKTSFTRDTFIVFFFRGISIVLMFAISFLLANNLGADKMGILFLVQSIVHAGVVVGMVGFGNLLIKLTAQHNFSINKLLSSSIIVVGMTSLVISISLLVFSNLIGKSLFNSLAMILPLTWLVFSIIPQNILSIYVGLYKGLQKVRIATFLETIGVPVFVLILIIVNIESLTLVSVAKYYVYVTYFMLLLAVIGWKFYSGGKTNQSSERIKTTSLIRLSMPLYGIALTNLLISVIDMLMLGYFEQSDVLGHYGVAQKIASINSIILISVNTIIASKFAIFSKSNDMASISILCKYATGIMALIALILLLTIFVSNSFIIGLFGSSFEPAKNILYILAFGQFIVLSTGPIAILLMMTGHEKFHYFTTLLSAFINIILNWILIPLYGGIGAAIATSISLATKNIIALIYINNFLKISTIPGSK